tara:strand:+ start:281 stop:436 length:156 start_codon:yes stop_codon:yes gene_type:complete
VKKILGPLDQKLGYALLNILKYWVKELRKKLSMEHQLNLLIFFNYLKILKY